jgi:hypothetical protein
MVLRCALDQISSYLGPSKTFVSIVTKKHM